MNNIQVLDRLSIIVESAINKKPYDKDIAKEIGLSPASYSNWKTNNKLPLEAIVEYCALKRVSISWLLYDQSSQMLADSTGDILKIPYLKNVTGSAGGGSFNEDESHSYLSLDLSYVEKLGITEKDQIDAINVTGESMHPTIKEGSIILIDKNKTDYQSGKIFALNINGSLFIKRLERNIKDGYNLISDNEIIDVQTVPFEEVTIVGRVIGALEKI